MLALHSEYLVECFLGELCGDGSERETVFSLFVVSIRPFGVMFVSLES